MESCKVPEGFAELPAVIRRVWWDYVSEGLPIPAEWV